MIVALEEAKYQLEQLTDDLKELGAALRIEDLKRQVEEMESKTMAPDFWNDAENSSKVLQAIKSTKTKIEDYEKLCARQEDAIALAEMAMEENDESCVEEVQAELEAIVAEEERQRIGLLLSGEIGRASCRERVCLSV